METDLYRHRCPLLDNKKSKRRVVARAKFILPAPKGMSSQIHELLCGMHDGEIKLKN